MYFKNTITALLMFMSVSSFSQIKIPDVGDGWKNKVETALELVRKTDSVSYQVILDNCKEIEYIVGDRSTCKLPNTIAINTKDFALGSVNNIAAILIHESHHLLYYNQRLRFEPDLEEYLCYLREYEFLCKLPDTEDWLFKNCINSLLYYRSLVCKTPKQ